MYIKTTGNHLEITKSIDEYVTKRISTLSKFVEKDTVFLVEISKTTEHRNKGDIFKAEAIIKNKNIFAVSEKSDMYQAIDDLKEELEKILSSKRGKKETLFRRGAQRIKDILKGFRKK